MIYFTVFLFHQCILHGMFRVETMGLFSFQDHTCNYHRFAVFNFLVWGGCFFNQVLSVYLSKFLARSPVVGLSGTV